MLGECYIHEFTNGEGLKDGEEEKQWESNVLS